MFGTFGALREALPTYHVDYRERLSSDPAVRWTDRLVPDGDPVFRHTAEGPDGSLYFTDTFNNRIRKVSPEGVVTTVAGNGERGFSGDDGPATSASLAWPHDVNVAADGTIYIADANNDRIRAVAPDGIIRTIGGTGGAGSSADGIPALQAKIPNPKSVVAWGDWVYVSSLDNRVRRISLTTGLIETVAGTGTPGFAGDGGPAVAAELDGPQRIALTEDGTLYIADTRNHAVRRVDSVTGVITTIAGTLGTPGRGADTVATESALSFPRGIAVDGDQVYVADSDNDRVRRIDLTAGTITTIAGGDAAGYVGDGGPASAALLYQPRGLTLTSDGRLIIADTFNSVIRVITPTPANLPPTAAFTASCSGNTCTFDATGSTDPDGTIVGWSWDFGGGDPVAATEASIGYTFPAGDLHAVTLTVTDDGGATASTTVGIMTTPGEGPTAVIAVNCTGNDCTFDASGSTSTAGAITAYAWDYGDGNVDTGAVVRHVFVADVDPDDDIAPLTEATVSLAVTDANGATDTTSVVVPIAP